MPAVIPADVQTRPSLTKMPSSTTRVAGNRDRSSSRNIQCVVARLPSSTPAAPSTNAPVQIETTVGMRAWSGAATTPAASARPAARPTARPRRSRRRVGGRRRGATGGCRPGSDRGGSRRRARAGRPPPARTPCGRGCRSRDPSPPTDPAMFEHAGPRQRPETTLASASGPCLDPDRRGLKCNSLVLSARRVRALSRGKGKKTRESEHGQDRHQRVRAHRPDGIPRGAAAHRRRGRRRQRPARAAASRLPAQARLGARPAPPRRGRQGQLPRRRRAPDPRQRREGSRGVGVGRRRRRRGDRIDGDLPHARKDRARTCAPAPGA